MSRIGFGLIGNVPVRAVIDLVRRAEEYQYDSFWMHETYFYRDALSYLSALVPATKKIHLATGCINPYTRHPVLIAMAMASLSEMSDGRMILGIGTGFLSRLDQMGIAHANPVGFLEESINIIRRLLRGEAVTYQGRHYKIQDVKPFFPKAEPEIPIYIAGWKMGMIKLAGKTADGYLARALESPQSLQVLSENLTNACKSYGRNPSEVDMAAYILCAANKKPQEARDMMRRNPFTIYQFAVMEDYVLTQTGFDPTVRKQIAEHYWKGDLSTASKEIPDELLEAFTATGTTDDVIRRIKDYSTLALPILQPVGSNIEDFESVLDAGRTFLHP